jgi:uncharacterized membrane protein YphA (DoxX/SURF4 family)
VKGLVFLSDLSRVRLVMATADFPHPALAEPIAVAHMAGGLLLAFGLWTRAAAAVQIPILVGAVLFVHLREGLFTGAQTLEFAVLVLVILCLFALGGAGPWSVDAFFRAAGPSRRSRRRDLAEAAPALSDARSIRSAAKFLASSRSRHGRSGFESDALGR